MLLQMNVSRGKSPLEQGQTPRHNQYYYLNYSKKTAALQPDPRNETGALFNF
jgi:hypothetical protein